MSKKYRLLEKYSDMRIIRRKKNPLAGVLNNMMFKETAKQTESMKTSQAKSTRPASKSTCHFKMSIPNPHLYYKPPKHPFQRIFYESVHYTPFTGRVVCRHLRLAETRYLPTFQARHDEYKVYG